jgi:hypothetical protein
VSGEIDDVSATKLLHKLDQPAMVSGPLSACGCC